MASVMEFIAALGALTAFYALLRRDLGEVKRDLRSDITRLEHPYSDVVGYIAEIPGLTSEDLRRIYGANTRRVLRWPAPN